MRVLTCAIAASFIASSAFAATPHQITDRDLAVYQMVKNQQAAGVHAVMYRSNAEDICKSFNRASFVITITRMAESLAYSAASHSNLYLTAMAAGAVKEGAGDLQQSKRCRDIAMGNDNVVQVF